MTRSVIVTVVAVSVSADEPRDVAFAADLDEALSQSVGRANGSIGQAANLRVFVRRTGKGFNGYYGIIDLELTSVETGRILYTGLARSLSSSRAGLINAIVGDVRYLVGVSGTTPSPVYGEKQPIVHPETKPVTDHSPNTDNDVNAAKFSDPLLNGTITPNSDLQATEEALSQPPVIDTSRPLLVRDDPTEQKVPVVVPKPISAPKKPDIAAGIDPAEDDLCIVTVDNDCTDPDE